MANSYGNWNQTNKNTFAKGTVHDAATRSYEKKFNLGTDADPAGGTNNTLVCGRVREGSKITTITITSSANLAGINFQVGIAGNLNKYSDAVAGPNAGTIVIHPKPATAALDAITAPEDILITPSANLPGAGTIVVRVQASHR